MELYNETVIEHDGSKDYWGVSTGEQKWRNRLAKLYEQYPDEVKLIADNMDGSVYYHIPKSWVKISPPIKRNLTEEQKAELRDRMKAAREAKEAKDE